MVFKIPRPVWTQAIVDKAGLATKAFSRRIEEAFAKLETQETSQDETLALIQQVQAQQAAQLALILANQTATQTAQTTANEAQATADGAGGGTAVSGSDTDTGNTVSSTVSWVAGPLVSLTGVVAGNLTVPGSAPTSSGTTVAITNINIVSHTGEFRIVEVIGGVDGTAYGPFAYYASTLLDPTTPGSYPAEVYTPDSAAVAAINDPRVSTGAVSYRMDFRRVNGPTVNNLAGYLFARRS